MNKAALQSQFTHLIEKAEQLIKSQNTQAEQLAQEALAIAKQQENVEWQAEALYYLASYNSKVLSQFKVSLELCEQALELTKQDILLRVRILRLMGMNEHYLGAWNSAQQLYQDAVQLIEAHDALNYNLEEELGFLFYYISVLYKSSETKDYPLECLYKSIDIFKRIEHKPGLARCYNMLANIFNEEQKPEKSLDYHLKALKLFEELNEEYYAAVVQNNVGYTYCELGELEKGFELLHKSLKAKLKFGNQSSIANSYIHLGMAHKLANNSSEAIKYFQEAEKMLFELDSKSDLNIVYQYLSEVFASTKNFEKAYEYHILYDRTKDEMFNFDKAVAIMDAKSRFELEEKKKEAELLRQKNNEIESYAHQLEISNNELKQFAYVASHDLKEPLRMISNYINLLEKEIEPITNESTKEYMEFIYEGSKRMYELINSLLEFSKLNQAVQVEQVNLNDIVVEIRNKFAENLVGVDFTIDNLPMLQADKKHIYRLFENLICNAAKFNLSSKKIVRVEYSDTDKVHKFKVIDNGIGIAKEYADKVFVIFQRLNARHLFPGTGIGLAICKKIVDNLKGEIWVEENEYRGSTFCVSIPKKSV